MEDRKLTPQESMAVITQMIEATKQRVTMRDTRISIMWALLSIVTALTVLIATFVCRTPWINFIWLAIPVIGMPVNILMSRKSDKGKGCRTAIDGISDGIWKTVRAIAVLLTLICIVFHAFGYPEAWLTMLFYAFIVVGFGAAAQGIVLKERTYILGGVCSVLAGFTVTALALCGIPLRIVWMAPLYMLCSLLMFILPVCAIRRKQNNPTR